MLHSATTTSLVQGDGSSLTLKGLRATGSGLSLVEALDTVTIHADPVTLSRWWGAHPPPSSDDQPRKMEAESPWWVITAAVSP